MRKLDTSTLGPIRVEPPASIVATQARNLYADAMASQGAGYRHAADSIRTGSYGNIWTEAALSAIERALRTGPDDL
jgi:hypothetical protein